MVRGLPGYGDLLSVSLGAPLSFHW
jgi:hypothetical protein